MIKKICIVFLGVMLCGIMPGVAHDKGLRLADVVKRITPSVVAIATDSPLRSPRVVMRGTGFVVHDGLHVITNAHVLPNASEMKHNEKITVLIGRGRAPDRRIAEIVRVDKEHDLALLRIEGDRVPKFELGTGGLADEGLDIAVTGYPIGAVLGLFPVTHRGIIAAVTPIVIPQPTARYLKTKIIRQTRYDVYQLDLTAFPGNSGSPLYNVETGKVLGILNSVAVRGTKENVLSSPSGISFAIPVVHLYNLMREAGLK
ncbi:S1 family peptidase [Paremcibacter congregatus]|nr:serine protease [Paremcibacter congregatus]